jgi:hypothetical protein
MEELQEADVLWPDAAHQHRHPGCHADQQQQTRRPTTTASVAHQRQSAPVRIPAEALSTSRNSWARGYDEGDDGGVIIPRASSGGEAAIVPPHVLAIRGGGEDGLVGVRGVRAHAQAPGPPRRAQRGAPHDRVPRCTRRVLMTGGDSMIDNQ